MPPLVSVLVLNYRQATYVPHCIDALMQQTYPNLEIIFTDNASEDGAVSYVASKYHDIKVVANNTNLYYSKAHNGAIKRSSGEYIMPLNVDVIIAPAYVEQMVCAMELDSRVGMVAGKLLQMDSDLKPCTPPRLDSVGLWFTPELRHFDRGSQERDVGQYDSLEYVFGPSGAAPLYRREMMEDVAFQGEYFDEDFVIYREDADLAWRAQWLGWKAIYTPFAVAWHVRRVRNADNRRRVAPFINMHSVKNRFLMRIKNQSLGNAFRFLLATLWRDLQVIGYVILVEHSSLPAFGYVLRLLPRMLKKRRHLMARKRVGNGYMARWFSYSPPSAPFSPENHKK